LLSNHLDDAEKHMSQALAIFRQTLKLDHEDLVPPLNSLAMILTEQNDLQRAKQFADEALLIARTKRHPFLNQVLATEGEIAVQSGRIGDADSAINEARLLLAQRYGEALANGEKWRVAVLDTTEAKIEIARGRPADARRLLSAAFPLLVARFGSNSLYATRADRLRRTL
jgi:tetratricopeptide (TPR) repeat protein